MFSRDQLKRAASLTEEDFVQLETQAFEPPKPKPIKKPYSWILEPYFRYLGDECELSETTIRRACSRSAHPLKPCDRKLHATVSKH